MSLINQMLRDLEARHSNNTGTHAATQVSASPQAPPPRASGARRISVALIGVALLGCGMGAGWYLAQDDTYKDLSQAEGATPQRIQVSEKPGVEVLPPPEVATSQVQHLPVEARSGADKASTPAPLPEAEPQNAARMAGSRADSALNKTAAGAKRVTAQGQETKTVIKPEPESAHPARTAAPSPGKAQTQTTARSSVAGGKAGRISFKPSADPLEQHQRVLRQGQQLYTRGNYPAAIATLQQHLEQHAGGSATASAQIIALDARIHRQLALAQLRLKQKHEAITTLEQGHIRAPADIALHILYARVLMEEEQHQRAYSMLRNLSQPHLAAHPDFYALRAALARQQGAYAEAIELYTLLCGFQPQRGDWRLGLAISQHQHGNMEQARANYQRAAANTRLDTQLRNFAAHQAGQMQTNLESN